MIVRSDWCNYCLCQAQPPTPLQNMKDYTIVGQCDVMLTTKAVGFFNQDNFTEVSDATISL